MIMDSTMDQLSCVPPGFRFHPTDEELVGYYLRKKVASQKIDLDVIRDIDLYRIEPWDLIEKCWIGYEEQSEWYFFSHKDKKYPTGTRTNRATMAGFWKATGRDKAIYEKQRLIGMRKTLVFYQGRAPNGQKTDWIMHEYRLESEENAPPQEEGWVVCRAFKKRPTGQQTKTTTRLWESSNYFYDHEASHHVTSVMNNNDYTRILHQPTSNILLTSAESTFMCKQELEASENMNFLHNCDQFLQQLPQLESPSIPSTKRTISSIYENDHCQEENNQIKRSNTNDNNNEVRDWRDLDKFVASQLLSQEEEMIRCVEDQGFYSNNHHPAGGLDFTTSYNDQGDHRKEAAGDGDGGIGIELRRGREGEANGLLSSTTTSLDHFDIGICIFDHL